MGKPQTDDISRDAAELINAVLNRGINALKKDIKRREYTELHFAAMAV